MSKTKHFGQRINQRGIRQHMVDLVRQCGFRTGDKIILDRHALKAVDKALRKEMKTVRDLEKKGGIVVVEANETLITSYRVDKYCGRH